MHTHEYSTSDGSVARTFHLSDGSSSDSYESFGSCSDFQDCPMTVSAANSLESNMGKLHLDTILSSDSMDIDKASPTKVASPPRHHEALSRPNTMWQKTEPVEIGHSSQKPFHRWVKSLRRRAAYRRSILPNCETPVYQPFHPAAIEPKLSWPSRHSHQKSSSGSSFGFVTAVRSTGVSLSSFGTAAKPRLSASLSHGIAGTDRSSRASMSITRTSEDSSNVENTCTPDVTQIERSLHRRRILEEIISTEESYIGDVRFLMNIYVTIFASHQSLRAGLRSSINQILADIIELHEDILGELHRAVPHSEYTQIEYDLCRRTTTKRRQSLSAAPRRRKGAGGTSKPLMHLHHLRDIPGMIAEPQVAAEVAKIFNRKMSRFFIYEEYGASYETLMNDIASSKESLPEWSRYQKGLEILGSTIGATRNSTGTSSKALSMNDLLVKPIQRVCRYPLLFNELAKYTSTLDCPNSQMEVESTLDRLREATTAINTAKDDQKLRTILEKTWLLQDRLSFSDQRFDAASKSRIRSFGHIQLCGALHISWPTTEGVSGRYMVCLLYTDVLCLASAGKADVMYTIHACIHIDRARIEDPDSGRGLQCHNAPFCWKLVFKCDHQLYEILMTACTAVEETEWRTRLSRPMRKDVEASSLGEFCSLDLNVQSVGPVFGKPGTIARRISVHRAATIGSKTPTTQVIIKNTSGSKDGFGTSSAASTVSRSQSLLATRVPVLAPPRSERARIEALLSDVWSHDRLPCPGMTARSRPDYLVRSSASTVMRKLSVASFASTLSKRSGSTKQKKKTSDSISSPLSPENQSGHDQVDGARTRPDEVQLAHEAERGAKRLRTASHTKSDALAPAVKDEDVVRLCQPAIFPMAPSSLPNTSSLAAHTASSLYSSRSVKYNHPLRRLDGDLQACSLKQRSKSLHSKTSERRREGSGHSFRGMFK